MSTGTMTGAYLPGNSDVKLREVPVPAPGPGQVLLRVRASTICGSDLRAIYHGHVGPERYDNVIAGHEPAGEVAAVGPQVERFKPGDRVAVYHIVGCGRCRECRSGYFITCTAPTRRSYGWDRDGGHADYLLAEESTCIRLPEELTFLDAACVACGFGTAYEALVRAEVSGRDAVLVTGLGPVGMGAGMLARAMGAQLVIGVDMTAERVELARSLGCVDVGLVAGPSTVDQVRDLTGGHGCEVTVDCSGAPSARLTALRSTRRWGRCVMVGEGNRLDIDVSQELIHNQVTLIGSWVTSLPRMEELLELLVRWNLHPDRLVTHRFGLDQAPEAYRTADGGAAGKVAIVMPPSNPAP